MSRVHHVPWCSPIWHWSNPRFSWLKSHEKYLSGLSMINIFMKMDRKNDITWYNYIVFFTIMDIYIYIQLVSRKPYNIWLYSYIPYNNSTMVSIVYNLWIFMKSIIPKLNRSVFPHESLNRFTSARKGVPGGSQTKGRGRLPWNVGRRAPTYV
jgi:hypothetical protein